MAKRAPNPNTKYGRKRILEENRIYNQNLTPEQRAEGNGFATLMLIGLLAVILIFLFIIGGTDAIKDWFAPKGYRR